MMKMAGDSIAFCCINIMAWPLHNGIFPLESSRPLFHYFSYPGFFYSYLFGIHLHQGELASEAQGMASVQMFDRMEVGGRGGWEANMGSFEVMYRPFGDGLQCMLVVLIKKTPFLLINQPTKKYLMLHTLEKGKGISS